MTHLLKPAVEVSVRLDAEGVPRWVSDRRAEPQASWVVEVGWWRRPATREYWKLLLDDRLLCDVFRDLHSGAWFLERIYD